MDYGCCLWDYETTKEVPDFLFITGIKAQNGFQENSSNKIVVKKIVWRN